MCKDDVEHHHQHEFDRIALGPRRHHAAIVAKLLLTSAVYVMFGLSQLSEVVFLTTFMTASSSSSLIFLPSIQKELVDNYQPSNAEAHILQHARQLGYGSENDPTGCNIWTNPQSTPYFDDLQQFYRELETYAALVDNFSGMPRDLRVLLRQESKDAKDTICRQLELHPDGLPGIFTSGLLSYASNKAGFMEPLLPPLRHAQLCTMESVLLSNWTSLSSKTDDKEEPSIRTKEMPNPFMRMDYMVHDFAATCRALRPHSRTILLDLGASLDFHAGMDSPAMYILDLYRKFGITFDHIYAFEMVPKDPKLVYMQIPDELLASYHWYNVGISPAIDSHFNPLHKLLQSFDEEDLIVVKLDVDSSTDEMQLARLILNDPVLRNRIDHFYFEHHVHMRELEPHWKRSMRGTIQESLQLFADLRRAGVAAHYWP